MLALAWLPAWREPWLRSCRFSGLGRLGSLAGFLARERRLGLASASASGSASTGASAARAQPARRLRPCGRADGGGSWGLRLRPARPRRSAALRRAAARPSASCRARSLPRPRRALAAFGAATTAATATAAPARARRLAFVALGPFGLGDFGSRPSSEARAASRSTLGQRLRRPRHGGCGRARRAGGGDGGERHPRRAVRRLAAPAHAARARSLRDPLPLPPSRRRRYPRLPPRTPARPVARAWSDRAAGRSFRRSSARLRGLRR